MVLKLMLAVALGIAVLSTPISARNRAQRFQNGLHNFGLNVPKAGRLASRRFVQQQRNTRFVALGDSYGAPPPPPPAPVAQSGYGQAPPPVWEQPKAASYEEPRPPPPKNAYEIQQDPVTEPPTEPPTTTTTTTTTTTPEPTTTPTTTTTTPTTTTTTTTTTTPRPTTTTAPCQADNLFVLDSTGSVKEDFVNQLAYMRGIVNEMAIGETNSVGVVIFASRLRKRIAIPMGDYKDKDDLLEKIDALPYLSGTTYIGEALKLSKEALKARRSNSIRANVVVLSDGFSTDRYDKAGEDIRNLPNTQLFAAGVPSRINEAELTSMVGTPDKIFHGSSTVNDLLDAMDICA